MKRCPACRRVFDRDAKFCQIDGTILADFNSDPLIGHTIATRYRLVQKLGSGPLGAVYLAAELASGRSVAVKILVHELRCDDDALKQCLWDARFATASRPSHIVRVYEVDRTDDGRVFIATEYLEGETVSDLIQREGALEPGRALTLASQIARGVAAASRAGVSHRDLKPQNVMVTSPDGRVKVTDFGVAWLRRAAKSGALMRLGDGATKYMAPEQWGGADADDRTDVYGIGAVLYAMLAGPSPLIARTRVVPGSDIRWEAPPPIRTVRPEIPVSLEHLLARAMEREPERRHNGIEAFAEDLFNLTASIIETQTMEAGVSEAAPSSLRVVPRVGIAVASVSAYLGLWRPYVERGRAYREQWRARWLVYRARWQAERDRWQVWSRAQMSGTTHTIAGQATSAVAGASRLVAGATRTVGHGLAATTYKVTGAAAGASRGMATAARTVAGAVGAAARVMPLAVRSVGHGLADISRAGAGAATRASGTVMLAAGTVASAAAAAARTAYVVSRAGARQVASISGLVMGAAGTVANSIAGTSRTVSLATIAAGHGLAGLSRAGAGAAMRASRAVGVATGTVAGAAAAGAGMFASRAVAISVHTIASAAAATAEAMLVVTRAAARHAALASRAVAGAAGTVAHDIAGASRAVPVAARVAGRGMSGVSRALADAATRVSRTVTGATRTAAGAVAGVVAGASRTIPVAAQAVGRGLAPASRAIAGTARGMALAVAAAPGMVAGAMAAAASRVAQVAARAARHGMARLSRAGTGAVTGASRVVTTATGGLADATAAAGRAVPAVSRAGVRGVAALSRPVVGAPGALAVRFHGATRQAIALASRRRDEGLRWMRANGRRLSLTSAAALVILGAMTWVPVDWRRGDRAEAPSFPRNTSARDSESAERGTIETESSALDTTSPRRDGNKISRADTLARPAAPPAPAADDRNRSLPLQTAREQQAGVESAGSSLAVDTRQPPAGPRVSQLSSQQISRIQTQAEQKLRRRGLLRVSAADRWGVTLETAANGEVTLAGVLRDMALYEEAVRLIREVPEVKTVRGAVEVSDVGTVPIVHSDSARIQVEIQQKLRSRGLLRESEADRWGVTVEVNPEGDVMLVGAVRDAEMHSEAVRRAGEVARVRQVKQDIKVMERDLQQ